MLEGSHLVVKITDTDTVIASYDRNATLIDLKDVPLSYVNAKVIDVACPQLKIIVAEGTQYDWEKLKSRLTPPRTPKNFEFYWTSVKAACTATKL